MVKFACMRPTTSRDVLSVFWQHTLRYKGRAFLIVVGILIATGADSVQPWILKRIFDLLAQYAPTTTTIETFIPALIALVVVQFVGWFFWRSVALITNRLQPWVMRDLEQTGFEYLLGHSYQFFADHFGGSLVRRVNRLARAYERLADEIEFHQAVPGVQKRGEPLQEGRERLRRRADRLMGQARGHQRRAKRAHDPRQRGAHVDRRRVLAERDADARRPRAHPIVADPRVRQTVGPRPIVPPHLRLHGRRQGDG
ncbi:ABC transporter ATP-binding protein [bacterium]|nr:ABC transporter ATP-binding protein [bacterium]